MGPSTRYVCKVEENYYFRIKTPKHIRLVFKSPQVKKSLRTKDLKTALHRAKIIYELLMLLFKQLEEGMLADIQINQLVDEAIRDMLKRHEENLAARHVDDTALLPHPPGVKTHTEKLKERYEFTIERLKFNLKENILQGAEEFLSWCVEEKGVEEMDELANQKKAGRLYLKKLIATFEKVIIPRLEGDYSNPYDYVDIPIPVPDDSSSPEPTQTIPAVVKEVQPMTSPLIKDLLDEFMQERMARGVWKPNTYITVKAYYQLFSDCFGEVPVANIKRKDMVDFLTNVIQKLPVRRNTDRRLKAMSLKEQIADTIAKKISVKSIQDYMVAISGFFNWCVEHEYIQLNPARNLSPRDRRAQEEKRLPYSSKDMETIIIELSKLPRKNINGMKNIDNIWITLIAMYQGMRENEICQLFIDDIVMLDGIPCFFIHQNVETNQSVKYESSKRVIPIHSTLLKLGFVDYVNNRREEQNKILRSRKSTADQKKRQKQLFQFMTPSRNRRNYTKNFVNFFGKFNRNKITNDQRKTFHSLRHNFISKLNNSSQVAFAVAYLAGHSFGTETSRTYTKPDFKIIQEELSRLEYDFDLFGIFGVKPFPDETIAEQIKELPVKE